MSLRAKGQRGFANFQESKYKELFSTLLQGYRDKNVSLTAVTLTLPIMHQWNQCFKYKCIFKLEFVIIPIMMFWSPQFESWYKELVKHFGKFTFRHNPYCYESTVDAHMNKTEVPIRIHNARALEWPHGQDVTCKNNRHWQLKTILLLIILLTSDDELTRMCNRMWKCACLFDSGSV